MNQSMHLDSIRDKEIQSFHFSLFLYIHIVICMLFLREQERLDRSRASNGNFNEKVTKMITKRRAKTGKTEKQTTDYRPQTQGREPKRQRKKQKRSEKLHNKLVITQFLECISSWPSTGHVGSIDDLSTVNVGFGQWLTGKSLLPWPVKPSMRLRCRGQGSGEWSVATGTIHTWTCSCTDNMKNTCFRLSPCCSPLQSCFAI